MATRREHETVMLEPAVTALVTDRAGLYVDGTFGRGGHSRAILRELDAAGCLLGIDADPKAIVTGDALAAEDSRFRVRQGSFTEIQHWLRESGWSQISGLLLDLGVSSPQLDEAERGFSFMHDGPLDMRMNPSTGQSASQWLENAAEKEIADVIFRYGEDRFARRIARAIVRERDVTPITGTLQLAEIVKQANPAWEKHKHPATRVFQAFRIHINNELGALQQVLDTALSVLRPGGRLVVISFHSLEDRLVKQFIHKHSKGDELPRHLPIMADQFQPALRKLGKAIKPSAEEVATNPRARSAIMRVAEKT